jgi:hypothetical protein
MHIATGEREQDVEHGGIKGLDAIPVRHAERVSVTDISPGLFELVVGEGFEPP